MNIKEHSKNIRLNVLRLTYARGRKGAHIGPSLSIVEILSSLFIDVIDWSKDLFILSKGHGGLAYYCGLKEAGIITEDELNTFDNDGGNFPGQPSKNIDKTIVFSSGSLGMGLSYAVGNAIAFKKKNCDGKIYCLIGDGESNEGSIWEAAMLAKQYKLDNLIIIVDYNKMQSDGSSKEIINTDYEGIWKAFGFNVIICDGHNEDEIRLSLNDIKKDIPLVLLCKTIKGKGISFIENNKLWHHNFLTEEQYKLAVKEVCDGI